MTGQPILQLRQVLFPSASVPVQLTDFSGQADLVAKTSREIQSVPIVAIVPAGCCLGGDESHRCSDPPGLLS